MKLTLTLSFMEKVGDMGTGLAPYDKARKTTPTKCQILVSLMTISVMLSKVEKFTVQSSQVFVSGAATEPILAKAILGSRELGTYTHPNQVLKLCGSP